MTDKAKDLMELAKSKFGTLSKSEETLFRSTDIGEEAKLSGDNIVLKADRIVWLCTDEEALKFLTNKGLQVNGARIEETLDLRFATPDIPITFSKCEFKEPICLKQAKVKSLNLSGSHLASSLDAEFAEIEGNVYLSDYFQAQGEVSLNGATIGGKLDCKNGKFDYPKGQALDNPKGYALGVQRAEIKRSIYLSDHFKALGTVSFVHTIIDNFLLLKKVRDPHEMILDLSFARIDTLADQEDSWPEKGNLFLDGLVYERINSDSPVKATSRLNWLKRTLSDRLKYDLELMSLDSADDLPSEGNSNTNSPNECYRLDEYSF